MRENGCVLVIGLGCFGGVEYGEGFGLIVVDGGERSDGGEEVCYVL